MLPRHVSSHHSNLRLYSASCPALPGFGRVNRSNTAERLALEGIAVFTPLHATMLDQDGLEWVEGTFGLEPSWTKEPDMNVIANTTRKHLGLSEDAPVHVTFHAQGAFNKLYKVSTTETTCLMRVSLPVDPRYKTESEVATIEYVRQKASMPVPNIIAFDSSNENELGFEWIMMEMMPGVTLRKGWRKMSWDTKEEIIRRLVQYQARLFDHRFQKIGNIFCQHDQSLQGTGKSHAFTGSFMLGRMVSLIFFWNDHLNHDVSQGPFASSHDWLKARLQIVLTDQKQILSESCDEDEIEDAEFAQSVARKLIDILPTVFLPNLSASEPSILFHDDLSMQNILVDELGQLTAVIDWECVSAVPLWRACQLPQLLEGRVRDEKPEKEAYAPDSDEEDEEDDDGLDNEGITDLYWEHLLEYEQTQLRKLFVQEMEKAQPMWVAIMKDNTLKADFEMAVHSCDNGWRFKIVKRWVDALVAGDVQSLSAQLNR